VANHFLLAQNSTLSGTFQDVTVVYGFFSVGGGGCLCQNSLIICEPEMLYSQFDYYVDSAMLVLQSCNFEIQNMYCKVTVV
jgi:hypothetical protein